MKSLAFLACVSMGVVCMAVESEVSLSGNWQLDVALKQPDLKGSFKIEPVDAVSVKDERCDKMKNFDPKTWGGWQKGYVLKGVKAQECSVKGALDPLSLQVSDAPGARSSSYKRGKDYDTDLDWGSVGRLEGGSIDKDQAVFLSYEYTPQRIDSIVISADGKSLLLKKGVPNVATPSVPELASGEIPVVNVYIPGRLSKLTQDNLYPVLETKFPAELCSNYAGSAEKLLPKTMKKLRSGEKLRILAWGDSVTDGGFLADKEKNRWQAQFVARLKERFPKANIELLTEAWGGHNTTNYLNEPPGSIHNYKEKVLDVKPDLIVMEFLNDSGLKTKDVNERYGKFLEEFSAMDTEWIINAPHYQKSTVLSQKDIDNDPREYVKAIREFAAKNNIALSDASMRYGRLWRMGVPFMTLMQNAVNHPNPYGMSVYADSLMNLFP
jgi:hypothetical protein